MGQLRNMGNNEEEKMHNLDDLLEKAKWSKLTDEELNYVVRKIENPSLRGKYELYTLIFILGKAKATQHRKLVESFLYYPKDPMISKIAVQTLCGFWNLGRDYLKELRAFVKGVEWDKEEDVRLVAISCAGPLLSQIKDKELMELLLDIFENYSESEYSQGSDYDDIFKEAAYESLADSVGIRWSEANGMDPQVIEKARQLIKTIK